MSELCGSVRPSTWKEEITAFNSGKANKFSTTFLEINMQELTKSDLQLISTFLAKNGPIIRLVITGCDLSDEDLDVILPGLKSNFTLTELDLGFNEISVKGANALLSVVKSEGCALEEVVLVGNNIEDDLERKIWEAPSERRRKSVQAPAIQAKTTPQEQQRPISEIHNSISLLLWKENEAHKRFVSMQDEARTLETKLLHLRKSVKKLEEKQAEMQLALDEGKKLDGKATEKLKKKMKSVLGASKSKYVINLKEVTIGEVLDRGGSGATIYQADVDGWQCVCKEMCDIDEDNPSLQYFEKEIQLVESLPYHKNIVKYLFHERVQGKIRLYMTRYRSSLLMYLFERYQKKNYFTGAEIRKQALELIRGLEFLHKHSIIHRDMKSDNIFVSLSERKEIAKIAIGDFDCAKSISRTSAAKTFTGTAGFMAPEVWHNRWVYTPDAYSFKADIFSYGMVLYEFLTLQMPFSGLNDVQIEDCMREGRGPAFPEEVLKRKDYQPLLDLYRRCSSFKPYDRPDCTQIKEMLVDMKF